MKIMKFGFLSLILMIATIGSIGCGDSNINPAAVTASETEQIMAAPIAEGCFVTIPQSYRISVANLPETCSLRLLLIGGTDFAYSIIEDIVLIPKQVLAYQASVPIQVKVSTHRTTRAIVKFQVVFINKMKNFEHTEVYEVYPFCNVPFILTFVRK